MSSMVFPVPQRQMSYLPSPASAGAFPSSCGINAASNGLPAGASLSGQPVPAMAGPLFKTTLGNGTQGYLMQKPSAQRSAILITLPTRALPPGVPDLLIFSLMQGSPATKRKLEEWSQQGLCINAARDDNRFWISAEAPAGQEVALANATMEFLKNPVVDPASFNTLKAKLTQSQQASMADPDSQLDNRMARRIFGPEHVYSRTPQQRIAELSEQTLPGVMAHHQTILQLLGQGNVLMVSPLPPENQRQSLMGAFGNLSAPYGRLALPQDRPQLGTHRNVLLPNESVERALIKTTWQVPDARDPDYTAFCLLRRLLSGVGPNSFFKTLRTDHSLVYAIQYDTADHVLPQGRTFTPSIKVKFPQIGQALEDIRQVTQTLCQKPVEPAVLRTVQREQLLALRKNGENSESTANSYMPWLNCPGAQPPDFEAMQAAINRVTPDDIQRVAQRIFNDPNSLRLMGVCAPTAVLQQWFPGQPLEKA